MLSVLIVDDEPYIREGLKILIDWNKEGYGIIGEAQNAFEAIEILGNQEIDVIFIDIKMPKMNGIELSSYIREKISTKMKIVFLTGYLDIDYINSAFDLKASQYLQKPIQPEVLLQLLKSIRTQAEQKKGDEKIRQKNLQNLKEYYLLDLINGVKNLDNVRYINQFFKNEHTIYYVHFNFYLADKDMYDEIELTKQLLEIRKCFYERLQERAFHTISHLSGRDVKALGMIVTGSMLIERHATIYEFVDHILKDIEVFRLVKAVALIGKKVDDISKLNESYKSALDTAPYQHKSQQIPLELRIISFLESHYMENITLKQLSEIFFINAAYLGQFFKKHYGIYLKDYLNSLRVNKAAELLETTSLKIYQVAEHVGYQSADSLISAFSKEKGITPQKYRTLKRGE